MQLSAYVGLTRERQPAVLGPRLLRQPHHLAAHFVEGFLRLADGRGVGVAAPRTRWDTSLRSCHGGGRIVGHALHQRRVRVVAIAAQADGVDMDSAEVHVLARGLGDVENQVLGAVL